MALSVGNPITTHTRTNTFGDRFLAITLVILGTLMMLFVSLVLFVTFIGAFLGVPLAIWTLFYFLPKNLRKALSWHTTTLYSSNCPYCDTVSRWTVQQAAFDCTACKNRVLLRENRLCRVD